MRTTLDLPDPLFRRLKARAALEGLSLKDLLARYVAAGLREGSRGPVEQVSETPPASVAFVSAFDVMQDGVGLVEGGTPDLATDPSQMETFGVE